MVYPNGVPDSRLDSCLQVGEPSDRLELYDADNMYARACLPRYLPRLAAWTMRSPKRGALSPPDRA